MFSIASGRADSELVVAKAIETGSATARINWRILIRAISAIGTSTTSINTTKVIYKVISNFSKEMSISIPIWAVV
ncbi:hypothetical protein D3C87_1991610 [compost metagenome]